VTAEKSAISENDFSVNGLSTSRGLQPDDYAPFKTLRIAVFDGTSWTLSGDPMSAD